MKKAGFGQNSQHKGDVCPETVTLGGLARPPFHDARAEKAEVCLVRCGVDPRVAARLRRHRVRCGLEHHENATERETCEHVGSRVAPRTVLRKVYAIVKARYEHTPNDM